MNRNAMIGVVVVLILLIGGFIGYKAMNSDNTSTTQTQPVDQSTSTTTQTPTVEPTATASSASGEAMTAGSVKEVTVTGSNFKFAPATITVKKGDTVKLTFQNTQGFHDFSLPDFNVQTKQISGGQSETVSFTASKTGSFEYFCSVGNHRAMGMKGTLIVQ